MRWLVFLTVLIVARGVWACAACACGDPTLTAMGSEKPFAGRLRIGLELTQRSDRVGEAGVNVLHLREQKLEASVTYAFTDRVLGSLAVPLVRRDLTDATRSRDVVLGPGDVELRGKFIAWQDSPVLATHLLSLHAGVRAPTAPSYRDDDSRLLPLEVQPGAGAFVGMLGAAYAYFDAPWSGYVSASGFVPGRGGGGMQAGVSTRVTAYAQAQPWSWLGLRLGGDGRWDARARRHDDFEPDSGGAIALASGEILLSPMTDLVLSTSARVPVVNALLGRHREGIYAGMGVVYDL